MLALRSRSPPRSPSCKTSLTEGLVAANVLVAMVANVVVLVAMVGNGRVVLVVVNDLVVVLVVQAAEVQVEELVEDGNQSCCFFYISIFSFRILSSSSAAANLSIQIWRYCLIEHLGIFWATLITCGGN